jgi:hypothetical protein
VGQSDSGHQHQAGVIRAASHSITFRSANGGDGRAIGTSRTCHDGGKIKRELLDLQQREEALIMRAAGDGLEILRRVDADPRAVLGVMIAKEVQAQVA